MWPFLAMLNLCHEMCRQSREFKQQCLGFNDDAFLFGRNRQNGGVSNGCADGHLSPSRQTGWRPLNLTVPVESRGGVGLGSIIRTVSHWPVIYML